ncbi:hypothetical protein LTR81_007221 [Elasticomyces elasticus]
MMLTVLYSSVMEEINSLRQQLSAAQFLVNTLHAQLQRAEDQYALSQQYHTHQLPSNAASPQRGDTRDRDIDPRLQNDERTLNDLLRDNPQRESVGHTGDLDDEDFNIHDEGDDSPTEHVDAAEYPVPDGISLPDFTVRTIFPSLADVKTAAEAHALAQGWTVATKKRDRTRIMLGCRKTADCHYHVRAEVCTNGARISAYKPTHTCINVPDAVPKRHQVSSLRFLKEEVPKLMEFDPTTPSRDIQEAVFQRFGTRVPLGQCIKLKGRSRVKKAYVQGCSKCGVKGHNKLTCTGRGDGGASNGRDDAS